MRESAKDATASDGKGEETEKTFESTRVHSRRWYKIRKYIFNLDEQRVVA